MRIAEYKQVSTRIEQRVIHHDVKYDGVGNITAEAWDETVEVRVPIMGIVYRDATQEEIADFERQHEEMSEPEPTLEEQLADLSDYIDCVTSLLLGGAK